MDISSSSMPLRQAPVKWIPLGSSIAFLFRSPKLLGWSCLLVLLTFALTWGAYLLTVGYVDGRVAAFFQQAPEAVGIWGWTKYVGWLVMKWAFFIISRIVAFYLAFILAYTLSAPGYVFLSSAAEKKQAGQAFEEDAAFTLKGIVIDLVEGLKIGALGLVVTLVALTLSFIPLLGQVLVLLLYAYYSALMFLDYPTSRRRWSLGRKIGWLRRHGTSAFRLGLLPAVISLIPIFNVFLMALVFPFLTVHITLNFSVLEQAEKKDIKLA
ncbi:MAG: EI24 domain-containing protein [Desulfocapsaceae bacterium]|nr:EI24 domain-containing protein [Desulfocapsaceae bacterium]